MTMFTETGRKLYKHHAVQGFLSRWIIFYRFHMKFYPKPVLHCILASATSTALVGSRTLPWERRGRHKATLSPRKRPWADRSCSRCKKWPQTKSEAHRWPIPWDVVARRSPKCKSTAFLPIDTSNTSSINWIEWWALKRSTCWNYQPFPSQMYWERVPCRSWQSETHWWRQMRRNIAVG